MKCLHATYGSFSRCMWQFWVLCNTVPCSINTAIGLLVHVTYKHLFGLQRQKLTASSSLFNLYTWMISPWHPIQPPKPLNSQIPQCCHNKIAKSDTWCPTKTQTSSWWIHFKKKRCANLLSSLSNTKYEISERLSKFFISITVHTANYYAAGAYINLPIPKIFTEKLKQNDSICLTTALGALRKLNHYLPQTQFRPKSTGRLADNKNGKYNWPYRIQATEPPALPFFFNTLSKQSQWLTRDQLMDTSKAP